MYSCYISGLHRHPTLFVLRLYLCYLSLPVYCLQLANSEQQLIVKLRFVEARLELVEAVELEVTVVSTAKGLLLKLWLLLRVRLRLVSMAIILAVIMVVAVVMVEVIVTAVAINLATAMVTKAIIATAMAKAKVVGQL